MVGVLSARVRNVLTSPTEHSDSLVYRPPTRGALPATSPLTCREHVYEAARSSAPPRVDWDRDNRLIDPFDVRFWTNIPSSNIGSSECLSGVQSLLNSPSNITLLLSFEATKAQMFIDFLDQVS